VTVKILMNLHSGVALQVRSFIFRLVLFTLFALARGALKCWKSLENEVMRFRCSPHWIVRFHPGRQMSQKRSRCCARTALKFTFDMVRALVSACCPTAKSFARERRERISQVECCLGEFAASTQLLYASLR
jgi:hypothetical protein